MIDSILQPLNQYQYVVARWDNTILNNSTTSAVEILKRIISLGYQVDVSGPVRFAPCPMDPDQFLVLKMASQAEARRICGDSENDGIVFDNTPISVVDLIGPRGVSLQNATDCMSIWHEQFDNDDLMELLLGMVQVNPPLKDQVIERDLHLIRKTFEAVIENASCQVFGSYASSVRKNGYSDIDLNVESIDTPEKPGSTTIRPLQQLVDDRTCLFEKPLTKAELYSFPPEDIIKALYRSFNRSVEIKKEFKLRYLPARTPIIVFTSRFMDGIFNVSFDISVNNRVSVQKAELLDWFMTQDCSKINELAK
uniref:Poly(A) RNA polymerase mitochondrial-like central palm domain-containing protein n=1 Tax=Caenorhabditis japonica TaxID=281687 RepID=A0A8R1E5B0_CAEJA